MVVIVKRADLCQKVYAWVLIRLGWHWLQYFQRLVPILEEGNFVIALVQVDIGRNIAGRAAHFNVIDENPCSRWFAQDRHPPIDTACAGHEQKQAEDDRGTPHVCFHVNYKACWPGNNPYCQIKRPITDGERVVKGSNVHFVLLSNPFTLY